MTPTTDWLAETLSQALQPDVAARVRVIAARSDGAKDAARLLMAVASRGQN